METATALVVLVFFAGTGMGFGGLAIEVETILTGAERDFTVSGGFEPFCYVFDFADAHVVDWFADFLAGSIGCADKVVVTYG